MHGRISVHIKVHTVQVGVGPLGSIYRRDDVLLCIRYHIAVFYLEFRHLLSCFVSFSASGCQNLLEVKQPGFSSFQLHKRPR
jgi:hypothetical protein